MLTARDRELLHWLGRIGIARTSDLMVRFGIGRTVAYRRVKALVDYGLVERHHVLHADDGLLLVTVGGLGSSTSAIYRVRACRSHRCVTRSSARRWRPRSNRR